MSDWEHKDEWRKFGKNFLVTVTRHFSEPSSFNPGEGTNRWAVYAYIYPDHPHFAAFDGDGLWQSATRGLPLHHGASFLRRHYDTDGAVTSIQVGADYHHLHDSSFTHCESKADAAEVFSDAGELFDTLTKLATVEVPT